MSRLQWRNIFLCVLTLSLSLSASASVVMTGSRIIYDSDKKSVDVQLRNNDEFPYVMQAWFDSGDQNSTPSTGKAPFIVTPPTFRMAAKDGQVVRIFYTNDITLPQDRESVFYFNFLQVPPANIAGDKGNQMVIMLKNRIKVFYRPSGIKENSKKLLDYLSFSNVSSHNIRITNSSPFYISLSKVAVKGVNAKDKMPMIAPFASVDVKLNPGKEAANKAKGIEIGLVNDYGAVVTNVYPIQ